MVHNYYHSIDHKKDVHSGRTVRNVYIGKNFQEGAFECIGWTILAMSQHANSVAEI